MQPSAQEVRDALERIVASEALAGSPQLCSFLRFVVEASLEGRGDRLKAYTIATGAMGHGEDFDAQTNPVVRVAAGRLRQALAAYDASAEGRRDPVRISLPRGG